MNFHVEVELIPGLMFGAMYNKEERGIGIAFLFVAVLITW